MRLFVSANASVTNVIIAFGTLCRVVNGWNNAQWLFLILNWRLPMMWKPVDFYLVCLFCLFVFFIFWSTLSPSLFSFQFHLPPFFFPRSFVVGLRVLLTLPGVAGFPARHRQESDRSEVRPSGTYIIIDDNMNTFTHISLFRWTALGLSTSNSSLGFSLLSWLVFIFSRQLYQTISITSRERSWGDPVWGGGREILNRNPVTHTHSTAHCISSISPLNSDGQSHQWGFTASL